MAENYKPFEVVAYRYRQEIRDRYATFDEAIIAMAVEHAHGLAYHVRLIDHHAATEYTGDALKALIFRMADIWDF